MTAAINYRIRDYSSNRSSQVAINVPDSISIENVAGYAKELAPLIDAVTDGYIDQVSAVVAIALPAGIKDEPQPGSDLEEGAEFVFKPYTRATRIPAFEPAYFLWSDDLREILVNTTLPPVAALISALIDGLDAAPSGGNQVVVPVDSRGEPSVEFDNAYRSVKKYKR